MPRGGHKVKSVKPSQVDTSALSRLPTSPSIATKPTQINTDRKPSSLVPSFLSRSSSDTKLSDSVPNQQPPVREPSPQPSSNIDLPMPSAPLPTNLESEQSNEREEDTYDAVLNKFGSLNSETSQSIASSSVYSRNSTSIYSRAPSIYSSASSIYSSEASIYSLDDCGPDEVDRYLRRTSTALIAEESDVTIESRLPGGLQIQQRQRAVALRTQEVQERSTLAKKAALFKNSRLAPQLPSFTASLPTWAMVCRAAQASQDCYDSQTLTRRGTYTPADTSKDIKAMIVDDQLIDESRLVIVSIRGTQSQSLTDWTVNTSATPVKPVGFLDDEENPCHAGFLQVAKAMANQVAAQLKQHPASSEKPSLLFAGHSAGGAIAALLYSHMLSKSVNSELTALASLFPSINCVTFGAPPLSSTPLPKRDHASGVFLSFANEGDPVLRLSNAASFKSLAKLMTASPPPAAVAAVVAPPVKVVRGSRGGTVYRQAAPIAPPTPWEELPLWPTPPASSTNAGDIILLRDKDNGSVSASRVTSEDLKDVIFGDFAQHTIEMYIRRVKELALAAMMGRIVL